jgi:hypothetical protein
MYGQYNGEPRFDRAQRHIEELLQETEVERRSCLVRAARRVATASRSADRPHRRWLDLPIVARLLSNGSATRALP